MHISKWLLKSSNILYTFYNNVNFFFMILYFIKNLLLEVGIDLGLLKKTLLKTSKIILTYSNSLARHFSSMFHAKCLLPRIDRLLPVISCLQNFYQCTINKMGPFILYERCMVTYGRTSFLTILLSFFCIH